MRGNSFAGGSFLFQMEMGNVKSCLQKKSLNASNTQHPGDIHLVLCCLIGFFFFFCFKPLTDIMSVVSDVFTGLMDVPLLSSVLAC